MITASSLEFSLMEHTRRHRSDKVGSTQPSVNAAPWTAPLNA